MKKTIITFLTAIVIAQGAYAQSQWLTSAAREMNYPADEYITGFVPANVRSGESQSDAVARAGKEAAKQASASIRTLIENVTETASQEVQVNGNYDFASVYQDYTRQTSTAEIAGLKIETHFDAATHTAYGFAYVKRSELVTYYQSQINLNLKKIEDAVALSHTAANAGQKMKAKSYCEKALENLANVEFAQDLLSAVAPANLAGLQNQRCSTAKSTLFQRLIDLEQSIFVFVKSDETNFGTPTTILANQLKSLLANNQCSFTTDGEQADYVITLTAKTRKHDVDNPNFKFTYADVQVDLFSNYKHLSVYNDELSVKGGAMSYETAGKTALKDAATMIWEKINPWIIN